MPLFLALLNHIRYLQFVHFDYGYNMQASVVVGVSYALLWVAWYAQLFFPSNNV